jgi:hypothetical protein
MFIRALVKPRFGEAVEPFINLDHIITATVGHDQSRLVLKMTNNEEILITGEHAQMLMKLLQEKELK